MGEILQFGQSEGIDQKLVEIIPGLWHGSRGPAQDDTLIEKLGVTQILSVTAVTLIAVRNACRWTLAIDDNIGWKSEQILFVIYFFDFIEKYNKRAIIHCDHGRSRSAAAMVLYKMRQGFDKNESYQWLQSRNPYVNAHPNIIASLPERL